MRNQCVISALLLGIDELRKLIEEKKLIEDLLDSEFKNPVGTGFDFRVGEIHKISGKAYMGRDGRITPGTEFLASWSGDPGHHVLKPGKYYLIKTIERVNLPSDIMAVFYPRSSFHRSGVQIVTGLADPGYRGELTFGISNMSGYDFVLEMGSRIVHALFFRVSGARPYRGKWQGGRMT